MKSHSKIYYIVRSICRWVLIAILIALGIAAWGYGKGYADFYRIEDPTGSIAFGMLSILGPFNAIILVGRIVLFEYAHYFKG